MQPCQVCGGMAVDQNGYCTQCGTFRGQPTQPVSGTPYPPQGGGYQPYQAGPAQASGAPWPSQTSAAPYSFSGPPVSGTPGFAPPQQGRKPLTLILIAASALVVVLIGAIVVVALARSGKGGGTPVADKTTTGPGPSAAPAIDPCLVGTWQATSEHQQQDYPGVGPVTLIGQGVVTHVHADGSATDDYTKASPYTGSYSGHSITMTVTGTVQARITTANGTLTFHDPQANGTVSYKVDGQPVGSPVALEVTGDPVQYSCQGKTATEHTTQYDVTMTKISDSP